MLAEMSVIVEKCVSICFPKIKRVPVFLKHSVFVFQSFQLSIFYIRAPKRCEAWDNFPPTLPFDGPGCVNKVLINVLK